MNCLLNKKDMSQGIARGTHSQDAISDYKQNSSLQ